MVILYTMKRPIYVRPMTDAERKDPGGGIALASGRTVATMAPLVPPPPSRDRMGDCAHPDAATALFTGVPGRGVFSEVRVTGFSNCR